MKSASKTIVAIVAVIAVIAFAFISISNGLVTAQENVAKYKSDIDSQLQRRSDLIPNLVSTVKGYAAHEESVFTAVSDARAKLAGASTVEEQAAANDELSSAVSRLLAIAEAYPELKANENFLDLQAQLEGTENRINTARIAYNEAVQTYNTKIVRFPGSVVAGIKGLEKAVYFEAAEGADKAPSVNFGD